MSILAVASELNECIKNRIFRDQPWFYNDASIVKSEILQSDTEFIYFCTAPIRQDAVVSAIFEQLQLCVDLIQETAKKCELVDEVCLKKFRVNLIAKSEQLPNTGAIFSRRCTGAFVIKICAKLKHDGSKIRNDPISSSEPLVQNAILPKTPPLTKKPQSTKRNKPQSRAPLPRSIIR